jgi:ubiquinone biosynthesis protein
VDWLLALFWYVTGFWAVIWLARRLLGTQVPPARTGVSGLVPPHVLARLATLQDRVAPAPSDEVTALLTAELGEPPEHMFTSFHRTPVAAASLAQVHRAQLASGAPVAVKALRPGVEDLVERDLDIMLRLARTAHGQTRWARRLGVRDLVQGFSDNLS